MPKHVQVTGRGSLKDLLGPARALQLPDDATVDDLLPALGLPARPSVFVVNGAAVRRGTALRDGDRVDVHPQAAGG